MPGGPPKTRITTAPARAIAATAKPAVRAMPRWSAPYQAHTPATSTQPSRIRPRGNSLTVTTIARTMVAAPTTSVTAAANRRLTSLLLRRPPSDLLTSLKGRYRIIVPPSIRLGIVQTG